MTHRIPPDHHAQDRRTAERAPPAQPPDFSWIPAREASAQPGPPPDGPVRQAAGPRLWLPDQVAIDVARHSCARLNRDDPFLARRFYEHLFSLAPQTRQMFPPDMTEQSERLFRALLDAVDAMDQPESIRPRLRALGTAHARRYRVTEEMYVPVGQALIHAVRDVTGDLSTLTASAWASVYQWLAEEMIAGARAAAADEGHPQPS